MSIAWPIVAFMLAQVIWWTGVVKNEWEPLLYGIAMHFVAAGLFIGWMVS